MTDEQARLAYDTAHDVIDRAEAAGVEVAPIAVVGIRAIAEHAAAAAALAERYFGPKSLTVVCSICGDDRAATDPCPRCYAEGDDDRS